ncbi:MAG: hypothetical protein ACREXP_01475, partial [Steroidobacteraceae bacterium]
MTSDESTENPSLLFLTANGRRCPRRMPTGWQPPVPAFIADLAHLQAVVVCSIGVQSKGGYPEQPLR